MYYKLIELVKPALCDRDSSGNPGMKRCFYQQRAMRSWNG
jgi:hypothetical protein